MRERTFRSFAIFGVGLVVGLIVMGVTIELLWELHGSPLASQCGP